MNMIRARSKEEIDSRQAEIVDACDKLYSQFGYEEINFKAIAELTSISRPTIYNYFKTKDDIVLALLKRELLSWQQDFVRETDHIVSMTVEEYSNCLTQVLMAHEKLFRLLNILFTSIEGNSSEESLADFYTSVCSVYDTLYESISRYFPSAAEEAKLTFQHETVAYVLGIVAMSSLWEKDISAIRIAVPEAAPFPMESICRNGLLALLRAL